MILTELNLNDKAYDRYWKEITEWRNKYSAHRVPDFRSETPDLKMARTVIFIYENWLHKSMEVSFDFSLEDYEKKYCKEVEETIKGFKTQ